MSEVEKTNSSSGAESADQPCGLTETQHSAGWRCTMCDALAPEYERCCASCAMPSSIVGCVRAMWDEYNRDEQCDYTAINRLIEHAADLADPEGVWDLSSEAPPLSPAEGRAGNPVADEPLPTLQSQARRVEELEGALREIARDGHGLQGIIEDHPGDTKARARAEASYWQAEVTWRRRHARSALSEGSGSSRELAPPDESGESS